MRKTINVISIE